LQLLVNEGKVAIDMMLQKQLTILFLLVAVLLLAFNAFAQDAKSGATKSGCTCQMSNFSADESGRTPDHCPASNPDNSCDCEGCCPDATEPSTFSGLRINVFAKLFFHPSPNIFFPKVYLTIFVPPESCSLT